MSAVSIDSLTEPGPGLIFGRGDRLPKPVQPRPLSPKEGAVRRGLADQAVDQSPEFLTVVPLQKMGAFVSDNVVRYLERREGESPGEPDGARAAAPAGRARSPAGARIGQRHRRHGSLQAGAVRLRARKKTLQGDATNRAHHKLGVHNPLATTAEHAGVETRPTTVGAENMGRAEHRDRISSLQA